MMPVNEENKDLRELVAETLKAKGVLGKVQAQIRASVFLALEEQDVFKDKSPFFNKPLKDFLKSSDGVMVISLVKEFLDFFNLEFTSMVFDPETHADIDYLYEGRTKLEKDLSMESCSENLPLLAHVLAQSKLSLSNADKAVELEEEVLKSSSFIKDGSQRPPLSEFSLSNINGELEHNGQEFKQDDRLISGSYLKEAADKNENAPTRSKEHSSLTSLSNLPPITGKSSNLSNSKGIELKTVFDLDRKLENTRSFDIENAKPTLGCGNSGGDESEIEEEIPTHNSNASGTTVLSDDNTVDVSVSKASGHGDYSEEV